MHLECCGITETGKQRDANQDQYLIAELNKSILVEDTSLSYNERSRFVGGTQGKMLIVADGIGGHVAGERASTLAVDTILLYALNLMPWFYRIASDYDDDLVDELTEALRRCDARIEAESDAQPAKQGMGTTITMAYVLWPKAYVVHVGDSRCYLQRDGELEQVTRDDTLVQELVDQGVVTPARAQKLSLTHLLTNVAGGGEEGIQPSVHRVGLQVGDTLLLCTDGLVAHAADEEIQATIARLDSAEAVARALVALANDRGGSDNITVVVAKVRAGQPDLAGLESQEAPLDSAEALQGPGATIASEEQPNTRRSDDR